MPARHTPRHLLTLVLVVLVAALAAACGGDGGPNDGERTGRQGSGRDVPPSVGAGPVHRFVALDAGGPLTKEALARGEIDVAVLFTSSAGEESNGWVHLIDDRGLQPAENFVPAVNENAFDLHVASLLDQVSRLLTEERVQAMMDRLLVDGEPVASVAADYVVSLGRLPGVSGDYSVGRAEFVESELVAEIYATALERAGAEVERTPALGFREVYFPTLELGEVDVMPEFVGSLLAYLGGHPTSELEPALVELRERAGRRNVEILEPAPAESKDGFFVTRMTARRLGLETVSDLATVERSLVFGGPAECPAREFCLVGLRDVYGLRFES